MLFRTRTCEGSPAARRRPSARGAPRRARGRGAGPRSPGVSIGPGTSALTRTPRPLSSPAQVRVDELSAALVAAYTPRAGVPFDADVAPDRGDFGPRRRHRLVQLGLAAPGDEDVRAFGDRSGAPRRGRSRTRRRGSGPSCPRAVPRWFSSSSSRVGPRSPPACGPRITGCIGEVTTVEVGPPGRARSRSGGRCRAGRRVLGCGCENSVAGVRPGRQAMRTVAGNGADPRRSGRRSFGLALPSARPPAETIGTWCSRSSSSTTTPRSAA